MNVPKRHLLDPEANAAFVIPAIALSFFVFAYSQLFGQVSILAFYGCWLPAFIAAPGMLIWGAQRVLPLLVLPAVATLSVLWSDVTSGTLRGGIQYGTTVFCGLVAARLTSIPNLAAGGVIGGLLVLIYSALNGSYAYDVVDGTYAFNGAFASKNQLGYFASLTLLFSFAVCFLYQASALWRAVAVAAAALALVLLQLSDSATSMLSVMFSFGVILAGRVLIGLPPRLRNAAIFVLICGGLALAAAALNLGAFDAVLGAFGKDTTLTGRTYLWQRGIEIGGEQPYLGLGYYAFWTPGRTAAEELWETFYITGKTGFHFHNTLIEGYVGLGLLGVVLLGALTLALVIMAVLTVRRTTAPGTSLLCAALALLFVLRSAVEIDFFTPYTAGSFLVPFLLLNMADRYAMDRSAGEEWPVIRLRRPALLTAQGE
ncbi:exopolysaccharide production protein ExoQ [Tranquillimonas rosea]|uniref:Exopolysaccharide production protein ExoQ n=1 Tax=Tranquillimonas rosea TaxID=641238 RepID=A0A1H9WSM1_9RHOB|nr:O-antigen ligase family protein [Tranquillimonas rosea]SES36926.1 exopolysaccharide production protein ExoQ [Tranquillimonas rosea]